MKASGSAIVAADEMEVSGAGTVITAETDALEDQEYYALELGRLIMSHGLDLVEGKMNESKKAKIAQPVQAPTDFKVYWVVRPGDEPVNGGMQFPGAIFGSEEEERLFEGWFLEDGTRLEDSRYYMGQGVNHVGNLDRDVTFYGHWRTAESGEGSPDGGDGFGTLLAVGAVVGVAGVVAIRWARSSSLTSSCLQGWPCPIPRRAGNAPLEHRRPPGPGHSARLCGRSRPGAGPSRPVGHRAGLPESPRRRQL